MLKDLLPSSPGYEVNASSIKAAVEPLPPPGPAGTKLKAYFKEEKTEQQQQQQRGVI